MHWAPSTPKNHLSPSLLKRGGAGGWGRWLAARLPLWLTAGLVLERLLGVPGLGTDWMDRIARRDRAGLAAWMLVLAILWLTALPLEQEEA